jgi:CheY-like chemotaxis protein
MDLHDKLAVVVDDDEGSLIILRHMLQNVLGCHVETARSGEEAEELLRANHVNIVFSDLSMPKSDGWKLIQLIRSNPALSHIVAIAVTAHVMVGDREKTIEAGFDGFLGKPLFPGRLKEDLDTIFADIEHREKEEKRKTTCD